MLCFVLASGCFAYRHAATTFYQRRRGFGGRMQHARIQEFLSVLFSPQIFYSLQRGSNSLLLRKLYLYFTEDPEGDQYPLFSRGGGGGPNANFYRNPYTYSVLVNFQEGVSGPPIPLWIRTWAMSS